jgi:hypothetical protein
MSEFLFDPPLQLPGNVTVRTLDDAAAFTRNYKTPRQPMVRDGVLHRLEGPLVPKKNEMLQTRSGLGSRRRASLRL